MAKSRVAPLKFMTIPRLELCAALMAVRLMSTMSNVLKIPIDRVFLWSDSITLLSWIKSTNFRFHVYVGNRIGEILESSHLEQWNYVHNA